MKLQELKKHGVEKEIYVCDQCGFCHEVCPIYNEIGWESASPRGKIYWLKQLYRDGPAPMIEIDSNFADRLFQCTLCGHCMEVCQTTIDILELWKAVRAEIHRLGRWPAVLRDFESSLKNRKNVYNRPTEEMNLWAMDIEETIIPRLGKKAKVAYFVGCCSSLMGRLAGIPLSTVKIMNQARIDFTVLGPEEWCCGNPLLLSGSSPMVEEVVRHNVMKVRELGVETLIATCAGCYRSWKQEYPKLFGEDLGFEVIHACEFLAKLIDEDKLKFHGFDGVVTYHDPCEIGRHCNIYEEPRKVLENIPRMKFIELPKTKKDCRCCGGGGILKATHPELALRIAHKKIDEIREVDANIIASACPACKLNIGDAIKEREANLEMLDITEIVASALSDTL